MKLIFIRHADPDYEKDSLTEKGWREAELLAARVRDWEVAKFFCSPLGRARDTARVSLDKLGRNVEILDWLEEFYVPVSDPETGAKRIPWDFMPAWWTLQPEFYQKDNWFHAPVMQSGAVETRFHMVQSGIDAVLAAHGYHRQEAYYRTENGSRDTLVFFCHLGVQFAVLSHLLGIAAPLLWQGFFVAPSSVTVLCTEERQKGNAYFRCKTLGDTAHLYQGGEPASNSGFFCEVYEP